MSDSMMELLELIDNNKDEMKNSAYLNLVNGLQELYTRTNGTFTTDYRQMYMDLQNEHKKITKYEEMYFNERNARFQATASIDRFINYRDGKRTITVLKDSYDDSGPVEERYRLAQLPQAGLTAWVIAERKFKEPKHGAPDTIIYEFGFDYTEQWHKNGKLHRDGDLPAQIEYTFLSDGRHTVKSWYKDGIYHRDNDKPAILSEDFNGTLDSAQWYVNGKLHRDGDKPAEIKNNGNSGYYHSWYQHGKQYREEDKPSYIYFNKDGTIQNEQWSKPRAGDKPDSIEYYEDGQVKTEQWLFRENNKPTEIRYNRNGSCEKLWYKSGKVIKKLINPKITPKPVS